MHIFTSSESLAKHATKSQVTHNVACLARWMAADLYLREIDILRFELSMGNANDQVCDCMACAFSYPYHQIAHSPMGKAEGKHFSQTVCNRCGGWPEMSQQGVPAKKGTRAMSRSTPATCAMSRAFLWRPLQSLKLPAIQG